MLAQVVPPLGDLAHLVHAIHQPVRGPRLEQCPVQQRKLARAIRRRQCVDQVNQHRGTAFGRGDRLGNGRRFIGITRRQRLGDPAPHHVAGHLVLEFDRGQPLQCSTGIGEHRRVQSHHPGRIISPGEHGIEVRPDHLQCEPRDSASGIASGSVFIRRGGGSVSLDRTTSISLASLPIICPWNRNPSCRANTKARPWRKPPSTKRPAASVVAVVRSGPSPD